jgi:chaperonin GroES
LGLLQPLSDRVIVKAITAEETTRGGIVLPDTAKEKPQEGEVLAVGPGKLMDSGKVATMDVKIGDRVVYSKYGGTEVKVNGDELIVLRQDDILGVVENGKKK